MISVMVKTSTRHVFRLGLLDRLPAGGVAGSPAPVASLGGTDEVERGLGQLDEVNPAGQIAGGRVGRAEPLCSDQGEIVGRPHGTEPADVATQACGETLHVLGRLGERRVVVEDQGDSLPRRRGEMTPRSARRAR